MAAGFEGGGGQPVGAVVGEVCLVAVGIGEGYVVAVGIEALSGLDVSGVCDCNQTVQIVVVILGNMSGRVDCLCQAAKIVIGIGGSAVQGVGLCQGVVKVIIGNGEDGIIQTIRPGGDVVNGVVADS